MQKHAEERCKQPLRLYKDWAERKLGGQRKEKNLNLRLTGISLSEKKKKQQITCEKCRVSNLRTLLVMLHFPPKKSLYDYTIKWTVLKFEFSSYN